MTNQDEQLAILRKKLALTQALIKERYDLVRPLVKQAVALEEQIRAIQLERGELFYAHYWRYRSKYVEECDTLEEARSFLLAGENNGDLSSVGIVGLGITLGDDWENARD